MELALRLVLDAMIYDDLLKDALALELLRSALRTNSIRLIRTRIEQEQLADTPDEGKRCAHPT